MYLKLLEKTISQTHNQYMEEIIKIGVEISEMEIKRRIKRIKNQNWFSKENEQDWQALSQSNKKKVGEYPKLKRDITTNTNEIQRIIQKYFKNIFQ
jgi:hypothetical protein